jgi:hypothetical protein
MNTETQQMKRLGMSTKRLGRSTKRTTTIEDDSESGAEGDYTITINNGPSIAVVGATSIRILENGELNLVTDAGRWFLFAPTVWKTAFPTQPQPGKSNGNA